MTPPQSSTRRNQTVIIVVVVLIALGLLAAGGVAGALTYRMMSRVQPTPSAPAIHTVSVTSAPASASARVAKKPAANTSTPVKGEVVLDSHPGTPWLGTQGNVPEVLRGVGGYKKRVYAVGPKSLFISNDGGKSWSRRERPVGDSVFAVDEELAYIGGTGLKRTKDGGKTWQVVSGPHNAIYGIWGASAERIVAVGQNGIVGTRDGTTFDKELEVDGWLHGVWGRGPREIYAVGTRDDRGFVWTFDGTSWLESPAPSRRKFDEPRGITGTSEGTLYMIGAAGGIWRREPGKKSWSNISANSKGELLGIGATDTEIFVVGRARTALVSTDGGASFNPFLKENPHFPKKAFSSLEDIWVTPTAVVVVGEGTYVPPTGAIYVRSSP